MSSQPNDAPMLLFEFEAALFQFETPEPQFEALSQLPPPMAASFSRHALYYLLLTAYCLLLHPYVAQYFSSKHSALNPLCKFAAPLLRYQPYQI